MRAFTSAARPTVDTAPVQVLSRSIEPRVQAVELSPTRSRAIRRPGERVGEGFIAEEGGQHPDDASAQLGHLAADLNVGGSRRVSVQDGPPGAVLIHRLVWTDVRHIVTVNHRA